MNPDFVDLLRAFIEADVRFLIVGAYALAHHGRPRATGALDVWVDATPGNAGRIVHALATFGDPMQEVNEGDFIGREAFIANKRAIGRAKDISDIEGL